MPTKRQKEGERCRLKGRRIQERVWTWVWCPCHLVGMQSASFRRLCDKIRSRHTAFPAYCHTVTHHFMRRTVLFLSSANTYRLFNLFKDTCFMFLWLLALLFSGTERSVGCIMKCYIFGCMVFINMAKKKRCGYTHRITLPEGLLMLQKDRRFWIPMTHCSGRS